MLSPECEKMDVSGNRVQTKVCYHCYSTDHLLAQCNKYMQQKILKKTHQSEKESYNNNQEEQAVEEN